MLWQQYRRAVLAAVPVGAALGVLLGLLVYFGGNPDYRSYGGWSAFFYTLGVGAVFGSATSLAALAGATLLLGTVHRRLRRPVNRQTSLIAGGAAAGAALLWFGVAVLTVLFGGSSPSILWGAAVIAVVIGGASAVVSIIVVESRVIRQNPVPAPEANP